MALEDAVVLAACIARLPESSGALRLYEAQRIPRTARMQGTSLTALRALQPRGWAGHLARDIVMRLPSSWLAGRQSWMFNFRAE
jgi:salicylate hydroxylase